MSGPERPSPLYERLSFRWWRTFGPRLPRIEQPGPPASLAPFELVEVERPGRPGRLAGTWFPVRSGGRRAARGAVLLLPPFMEWGRAYFHRRGRLEALRRAGYHALTADLPGLGGSGPVAGFFDRDVEDALRWLKERAAGLPVHVWGVSAGGYWAHMTLSRTNGVRGAMFEDVSPHLLEWAGRFMPAAKPAHLAFRTLFPKSFRYFDLRRHAPALRVARAAYVSGKRDLGVRPRDTRELAELAGGEVKIVPRAGHLESIKLATDEVVELALRTFAAAEKAGG
ncbi:MAG TPA: alpha/beta fold hydrolase [Thermoanaerobaculia bacterium]